jgi:AraC family transcriptional regulator
VPGLNIVRARSWVPVTVQEVESAGGEGVWRSDKHRLSLVMSEAAQMAVQFDSGPARESRGPGPRLFFCPAGATMRVRSGPMRWIQAVQEPGLGLTAAGEIRGRGHALEPLTDVRDPLVVQMMIALVEAEDDPSERLLVDALNTAIWIRIRQKLEGAVDPSSPGSPGLSRRQLRRVCDFIEANLGEELTLAVLAEVARLSPWHFSRCFKRATGLTPHGYVTRRRMERAKVLLGSGGVSIAETASAVGFKSVASFTTCFGREVGVTPGQLRKEVD